MEGQGPEGERTPAPESPGASLLVVLGSVAIAEIFARVGIEAIRTGAPEVVLSSIVDGAFVVGATFCAAREWVRFHGPKDSADS